MTEHAHHNTYTVGNKLKLSIVLTSFILAAEVVAGFLSNSLALLSDAGHVFTDMVALFLSWYGIRQAERPSSSYMTFGYHRIGVVVAIVNALSIFAIAVVILYEAYHRLQQPPEVNSLLMLPVATIGLGANAFVAFWLRREQRSSLNMRSAFWHALGDALASIGVIIGGLIMLGTGWFWVDPTVSVFISLIIIVAAWRIFREGFKVLLEATPGNVNIMETVNTLKGIPEVKDVHDVHVWSISPELRAMSCHVLIDDISTSQAASIREKIERIIREQFHIQHTVLQMECQECKPNDIFCSLTFGAGNKESKGPPAQR